MSQIPLIDSYKVSLRPIQQNDIETVRLWRNDPTIAQWMLNQDHISFEQQQAWFKRLAHDANQWHFVIWFRGDRIGVVNLKSLDGQPLHDCRLAEPGLYVGSEQYRGNFVAFCPALALNDYCFNVLNIDRLEARVLNNNQSALKFNSAIGYAVTDVSERFTNMSLTPEAYFNASEKIRRLIR